MDWTVSLPQSNLFSNETKIRIYFYLHMKIIVVNLFVLHLAYVSLFNSMQFKDRTFIFRKKPISLPHIHVYVIEG